MIGYIKYASVTKYALDAIHFSMQHFTYISLNDFSILFLVYVSDTTEDVYQYKISVIKGTLREVFHLETHTTL